MFIGIGLFLTFPGWQYIGALVPSTPSNLLLETGDVLLLETGDKLLLQ